MMESKRRGRPRKTAEPGEPMTVMLDAEAADLVRALRDEPGRGLYSDRPHSWIVSRLVVTSANAAQTQPQVTA